MLRGAEKRMIVVRTKDSRLFEEAYFVIRRGVDEGEGRPSENDMVREATRIVSQNSAAYPAARRRSRWRMKLLAFLAGAAAATSIFGGAWLLALL